MLCFIVGSETQLDCENKYADTSRKTSGAPFKIVTIARTLSLAFVTTPHDSFILKCVQCVEATLCNFFGDKNGGGGVPKIVELQHRHGNCNE